MRSSNVADAIHGVGAATLLGATLSGMTIQDWTATAALIYSMMLIAEMLHRWWTRFIAKKIT
ncbi:MAG: hypothetical protein KGL42_14035 [Betaproteobacteria bacterium]|nr:hypothetical protein [Betaproteobacteria bacterium]